MAILPKDLLGPGRCPVPFFVPFSWVGEVYRFMVLVCANLVRCTILAALPLAEWAEGGRV